MSSVGSEANLQHKQVFSKHGRLKKIRGRLKIDSTEQWLELEFPSHTAIFDLGNLPALINYKYGMASFIQP